MVFVIILLALGGLLRLCSSVILWAQYSPKEFTKHLLFHAVILVEDILVLVPVKHNDVAKLTIFIVGHVGPLTLEDAPSW